jgi:hypothetical protein
MGSTTAKSLDVMFSLCFHYVFILICGCLLQLPSAFFLEDTETPALFLDQAHEKHVRLP